uniref:G-protein coupled receptors family 1 profile domain-containing protein n=1 Tax=Biomphalaria glabrata TaxID=6526 RepID=A0A2C9LYL0_BIOGL
MPHECNLIMSTLTTPGKTNSQNYTLEEIQHYLSELQYQSTLAYIPTFVYMSIIVFVGFFGNCMVIIVYCSKMTTTSLRLFMVVMAIFDLLINTIVIPWKMYDLLHIWNCDLPILCKLQKYLNASVVLSSAGILVAIAATRYRMVCHPFGRQVSIKQSKLVCIWITLTAFVISGPYGVIHGTQTKKTPNPQITGRYWQVDDSYVKTIWPSLNSGFFMFIFSVSCTLVSVLYIRIGRTTWRKLLPTSKYQERYIKTVSNDLQEKRESNQTETSLEDSEKRSVQGKDLLKPDCSRQNDFSVLENTNLNTNKNTTFCWQCSTKTTQTNILQDRNLGVHYQDTNDAKGDANDELNSCQGFSKCDEKEAHFNQRNDVNKTNNNTLRNLYAIQNRHIFGKTSLMLFTVTLVFIIGFLPFLGLNVFMAIDAERAAALEGVTLALYQLFLSSYLLNSFANPIVYSLLDRRFRMECWKLLKRS